MKVAWVLIDKAGRNADLRELDIVRRATTPWSLFWYPTGFAVESFKFQQC